MNPRTSLHRTRHNPERGAALILAVGVMLLVGLISGSLLAYIATSVKGRSDLDAIRNRQYAADAAIEYAVDQVRALGDPALSNCGGPYSSTLNGSTIHVICDENPTTALNAGNPPTFYLQRNVVFTACATTDTPCPEDEIVIRAQVNYEVPPGSVTPIRTYVQSWSVNR
ncbi:MAG: hypothetical protein ABIQ73_08965 [Acidimicrobiales bacterium]